MVLSIYKINIVNKTIDLLHSFIEEPLQPFFHDFF
jgi:hypothetical protein